MQLIVKVYQFLDCMKTEITIADRVEDLGITGLFRIEEMNRAISIDKGVSLLVVVLDDQKQDLKRHLAVTARRRRYGSSLLAMH